MASPADLNGVNIRPVRQADLLALEWEGAFTKYRRLYRQTYADTVRGQRLMLVAEAGEALIGQVFVQLTSTETLYADGVNRAYLYALRVRPEWRGRGLGTRLVEAAEAALLARGFSTAVIAAGKDNEGARRLYERLGYRVVADDPGVWYFTDVNGVRQSVEEPCWVMEKALGAGHEEDKSP